MQDSSERLKRLHESIAPMVRQGRLQEVCSLIAAEREKASTDERSAEAATLSIMLASFLSVVGRREEGLSAHAFAEEVEPENPHNAVATARYLLSMMNDPEAAATKIAHTLSRATSPDHKFLHNAHSILGRCALRSQSYEVATSRLQEARAIASAHDLPAISWDFDLARELVTTPSGRSYLDELLQRARLEGDSITENRVVAILQDAAASGQP